MVVRSDGSTSLVVVPTSLERTPADRSQSASVSVPTVWVLTAFSPADATLSPPAPFRKYFARGTSSELSQSTDRRMPPLANRQNQISTFIGLLEPLRSDKLITDREQILLRTLADDYVKSYQHKTAAQAYTELLNSSAAGMSAREHKDVESTLSIVRLLGNALPQNIEHQPVDIPTKRDPAGLIEAAVTISGKEQPWVFDTGAGFSVISRSFASSLRLPTSQQSGITQGVSRDDVTVHTAVIPELQIGRARVHNVVVLVLEDKDLAVPELKLQISGIIGTPSSKPLRGSPLRRMGALCWKW